MRLKDEAQTAAQRHKPGLSRPLQFLIQKPNRSVLHGPQATDQCQHRRLARF